MPYKYKSRSGRYVKGQQNYEPILDAKNWDKDSKDIKTGSLSP